MGILLGIGNIEKVTYNEVTKSLKVEYSDGHSEDVSLARLSDDCAIAINNEIQERLTADTTLTTAISNEIARAKAAESSNTSLTNAETSRAKSEESSIKASIANKADKTEVANEKARAEATETSLFNQLQEEVERATSAEQAIEESVQGFPALVTNEATTRIAEDAKLNSAIIAETNRAKEAERKLENNRVTDVKDSNGKSIVINGIATLPEISGGTDLNLENGQAEGSLTSKNSNNVFDTSGRYSFALGKYNTVLGSYSLSVGNYNYNDIDGYLLGYYLKTRNPYEFAVGKYNLSTFSVKDDATAFSVGNGSSDTNRSNAFEVKQNGLVVLGKSGQIAEGSTYAVSGAEVWAALQNVTPSTQVQSDWNEEDESAPSYIKGKPSIPSIEGLASYSDLADYVKKSNDEKINGFKTFNDGILLANSYSQYVSLSATLGGWTKTDGTTIKNQPYLIVSSALALASTNAVGSGAGFVVNGDDVYQFKNKCQEGSFTTPSQGSFLVNGEVYNITFSGSSYILRLHSNVLKGHVRLYTNIEPSQTLNIFLGEDPIPSRQWAISGKCMVDLHHDGGSWEAYITKPS